MSRARPVPGRWMRAAWTPEFLAGMVLPVAVLPTAFNSGVNLLFLLGSMLLAYMLLAVLMGLYNLKGVRGDLVAPLTFEEGQTVRIRAQVSNDGRAPAYDLRVRPRLRGVADPPVARVGVLPPGETRQAVTEGAAMDRGVHSFDQFVVESPFPISFMRTQRRYYEPTPGRELVIVPRLLEVDFQEAFGADEAMEGEDIFIHGVKGGTTYYGVRGYRAGDPLRAVHWKLSARSGKLLVKEFQQPLQARYYLFLDLDESQRSGEGAESNLEYLIRLAASLGQHLERNRSLYHFVWFDQASGRVQVSEAFGAGGDLEAARRLLAGLEYHPETRLREMVNDALHALTPGNRLVLFLPRDPETLPDDVAGAGFPAKAIFLVQASQDEPDGDLRAAPETGLAAQVDLYRYSIPDDRLDHERR